MVELAIDGERALTAEQAKQAKSMTTAEARAYLTECSGVRGYAENASKAASVAILEAKQASRQLESTMGNLNETIAKASSFDAQWEAFKSKFDNLNKVMVERLTGMVGPA